MDELERTFINILELLKGTSSWRMIYEKEDRTEALLSCKSWGEMVQETAAHFGPHGLSGRISPCITCPHADYFLKNEASTTTTLIS